MSSSISLPSFDCSAFECFDFQSMTSCASQGEDTAYDLALEHLTKLAIGIAGGALSLCISVITAEVMMAVGLEQIRRVLFPVITDLSSIDFKNDVLITPVFEEVLFRGIIQPATAWFEGREINDMEFTIAENTHIKLSAIIAIIATSILFGSFHYHPLNGIIPVVTTTFCGIIFGLIKEIYGLESSIAAHMAHNGFNLVPKVLPTLFSRIFNQHRS